VVCSDSFGAAKENTNTNSFMTFAHDVKYSCPYCILNVRRDEVGYLATCCYTIKKLIHLC